MNFDAMSREELIEHIRGLNERMDNVIVFWGGKKEFLETFQRVADNEGNEYTSEEARNAGIILESEGAFDDFITLVKESFERGGINYVLSEKVSAIMEEVAERHMKRR
jgi:hypothetical protein